MTPGEKNPKGGLSWKQAACFSALALASFHLAFADPRLGWLGTGFVAGLVGLSGLSSARLSFYTGLVVGFCAFAPQLGFFWNIFGPAAVALWLVLAFWIAVFAALARTVRQRLPVFAAALVIPFLWTGLEYFRSELYFLRFSWFSLGFALHDGPLLRVPGMFGVQGTGFVFALMASALVMLKGRGRLTAAVAAMVLFALPFGGGEDGRSGGKTLRVAGVQSEFAVECEIPELLDAALAAAPDGDIFLLGEYCFDGPIPPLVRQWCRKKDRYVIAGGRDPVGGNQFYNTVFVVNPEGDIEFKQAKSVPIQFFQDGLPAPSQSIWESPWGRIGIGICYDLSYTRVMDGLARLGAQAIIIPTMDMPEWGRRQHVAHSWVGRVRAAEYGVPVIRAANSGISQIIDRHGRVLSSAAPGEAGGVYASTIVLADGADAPLDRQLGLASSFITAVFGLAVFASGKPKGNTQSSPT